MSQEIAIVAILQPAPGKRQRCKEVIEEAIAWVEANEPETLEFRLYEELSEEGSKMSMFERFASHVAVNKHEGSDNYKKLFETFMSEGLLEAPPLISKGSPCKGFAR